jgi:hypothetical protein
VLWTIWAVSVGLAALSLATMGGLMTVRALGRRRATRLALHRRALLEALLLWVELQGDERPVARLIEAEKAVAIDVLVEIFENLRGEAQARLAELAERAGLVDQIRGLLAKGPLRDRLAAAECLLWFPGEKTSTALQAATRDREIEVGLAAAGSLLELGQELALETLLAERFDRPDSSRRLEQLLARAGRLSPARLLGIAENGRLSDRVRVAALEALSLAPATETLDRITALTLSPSVDIRAAAARCLGAIGHPASAETIGRLLADPAWQVRVRAADAAASIGALELGPALVSLVDDENWWVRLRSAEALVRLGESGIVALKAIVADGAKPESARAASLVLAENKDAA